MNVALGRAALMLALAMLLSVTTMLARPPEAEAADCTVTAKLVNPCRPWIGAASNNYVNGFRASILHHENRAGRQVEIVHSYHTQGEVLSSDDLTLARRPGTILMTNYRPNNSFLAASGGNATVNAQIDRFADSVNSLGDVKIFLNLFHEPEDDISPGGDPACPGTRFSGSSGTVAQYRTMWHNVRARFDAKGVDNVVWVMNYMGWRNWLCTMDGLWPGNEYVDWVMWDPYPGARTYRDFVSETYNHLTSHSTAERNYLSKPWGLAEYGYVGDSQAAAYRFYDDIRAGVREGWFPKLQAYVNWDGKARRDNRVLYSQAGVLDQAEQNRYNALVHDPLFANPVVTDPNPPSSPTGLAASATTVNGSPRVTLSWQPATDDVAVTGHAIYRNGQLIAQPGTATTYLDTAVSGGTTYTYTVAARDLAGNLSPPSAPASVTTPVVSGPDTTPPSAPGGLTVVAGPLGSGQITISWTASTDNVGVASYRLFRNNAQYRTVAGTGTSFTDTGLTAGTSYAYKVYAVDAAGNWSGSSGTKVATAR